MNNMNINDILSKLKNRSAIAYVDGSYNTSDRKFSYGIIMFTRNDSADNPIENRDFIKSVQVLYQSPYIYEYHMSKAFSNEELAQMRNVAGEIMGAAQAMKSAAALGMTEITIYHDYEGVSAWCLGKWKTKKKWTQKYKYFYDSISENLKVNFIKVKGHSGDIFNDIADNLAKDALGIK